MRNDTIEKIEKKYGHVLFRMGLTHLVDVGARNLTEEKVDEAIRQIKAENAEIKARGGCSIMTVNFQVKIVCCAAELAKCDISELLDYIKECFIILED